MEQERLAVERLHQTHDSLRAYRPKGPLEAILGATEPEPSAEPVADPAAVVEFQPPQEERPIWMSAVNSGQVPVAGFTKSPVPSQPRWIEDQMAGAAPEPIECASRLRSPVNLSPVYDCGFDIAGAVHLEIATPALAQVKSETALVPMEIVLYPVSRLTHEIAPVTLELEGREEEEEQDPAPLYDSFVALPHPSAVECAASATDRGPIESVPRAQLPLDALRFDATLAPAALLHAGLRELPVEGLAAASPAAGDALRAIEFQGDVPQFVLATPPLRPRLRLAAGRRYPVEGREALSAIAVVDTSSLAAKIPSISMPARDAKVVRAASEPEPERFHEPTAASLVTIAGPSVPADSISPIHPAPAALSLPQPVKLEAMRPASKLEPIDAKPVSDFMDAPPQAPAVKVNPRVEHHHLWTHAIDFWKRAPRDMKILVFAIPLLLGLALNPSLPKVRVAAPAVQRGFKQVVNQQLGSFRHSMLERAAIALDEDFRTGLDDWVSRGDATTEWSFDATGFVRPGPLAMYRPSMGLTDYQLQFLGMLDKKALSWVVRAVDFDNYYVIKLVVLKPGPVPQIGLTRYAVINGKADSRGDVVVPIDARGDMLYRVRLDVHGDDFALSVQGQMVDSWSEPRLTHGGIGFFAAPGEESRLRWVQVTHQYDMLGRLCAYLAPYNIASANGSWQQ